MVPVPSDTVQPPTTQVEQAKTALDNLTAKIAATDITGMLGKTAIKVAAATASTVAPTTTKLTSKQVVEMEAKHGAHK